MRAKTQSDTVPPIAPLIAHTICQFTDQQTAHAALPAYFKRLFKRVTQFVQIGERVKRRCGILEAHLCHTGIATNGHEN